ncbi:MAG: DUF389 domain-containing protein [Armatimonadota bacterium]|nr:DUF389 domain-containing protein [Armatimonadota bacterium]
MPEQAQLVIERRRALRAEIRGGSRLSSRFFILNGLAAVIAAYGLLLNSPATVIGSVVLAQELGPIMGISLALNDGDLRLLRRSLVSEAVGIALILAISIGIGAMHRLVPAGAEILTRVSPTIMDLAVALAAGAAGAYAATSSKVSQAIVGVAITTSLLPPLAASGLLLARGEEQMAIGAALLFLTNLVAIQFAAAVVFFIAGFHARLDDAEDRKDVLQRNALSLVLLVGLATFLGYNFKVAIEELDFKQRVESSIRSSLEAHPGSTLAEVRIVPATNKQMIYADILTPASIAPERVGEIERSLPSLRGDTTELHVRSVLIKEATSSGYLHEPTYPAD